MHVSKNGYMHFLYAHVVNRYHDKHMKQLFLNDTTVKNRRFCSFSIVKSTEKRIQLVEIPER